jgi:hypothetical protein
MSKKTKKGKTMALTDFLASEPKLVTVRESTWAAIVDEEEEQKKTMGNEENLFNTFIFIKF